MEPKRSDMFWRVFSVLLLVVLAGLAAVIYWHGAQSKPAYYESGGYKAASELAALNPVVTNPGDIYWIADLADKTLPFVVNISTEVDAKKFHEQFQDQGGMPDFQELLPEPFRRQFEQQGTPDMELPEGDIPMGEGSGFIIREDGYIITNAHVVEGGEKFKVRLASDKDEEDHEAKLIGIDSFKDIAVLKIDASKLPVAMLGDSDKVRIGEPVVAIGSPLGFEATVTAGIISTNKRKLEDLGRAEDVRKPKSYLQTDAAINRGNSGGPLINSRGEVIGINQAIARWEEASLTEGGAVPIEGIGFAIPINDVKSSIQQIISSGKDMAYPGISAQIASVKDYLERNPELKLEVEDGVYVVAVTVNGPAAKAGINAGDVILSIEGKPVSTGQDLIDEIQKHKIGERVTLRISRQGSSKQEDITVVLDQLDTSGMQAGE